MIAPFGYEGPTPAYHRCRTCIRAHRLHVAAALLASGVVAKLVREGQAEALDVAAAWVWEQDEPWAEVWHELRDRAAALRAPRTGGTAHDA